MTSCQAWALSVNDPDELMKKYHDEEYVLKIVLPKIISIDN